MALQRIKSSLPRPHAERPSQFTKNFWQGLSEGRFQVAKCRDCEQLQFPPRPRCPQCLGGNMVWREVEGSGKLYARTRIRAAGDPFACMTPYSVGLVDLDEGVRILTRLMHEASSLAPGSAVQLVVVDHTDGPLFAAIPAA